MFCIYALRNCPIRDYLPVRKLFYGLFEKIAYKHRIGGFENQLFHHLVFNGRVEYKRIRNIFIYRFAGKKSEIPEHLNERVAEIRKYKFFAIPVAFIKAAMEKGDFYFENCTLPMVMAIEE